MRYGPGHKEDAQIRILGAAGRGFRRLGYGGIGVDGLAKEAGVTSGAFYGHFPSKAEAFKAAALAGLVELRGGIEDLRAKAGDAWLEEFADFYMSVRRTCDLSESCALQSLSPDVARADAETRTAYEAELLKVVDAVADGLPHGTRFARRKTAWAILSILSGGVTLARSGHDQKVGATIASAIKAAVLALARS
ncbi:TetR/AcrR family transcriptional regulator [Methylocapsa sp. S129]|uniref:TetR/AcrR family transcriptional regulator n=1 Tax=Methylocapsa sp. S129 TaxID=1641869 RepID=UPI00131D3207